MLEFTLFGVLFSLFDEDYLTFVLIELLNEFYIFRVFLVGYLYFILNIASF